MNDHQTPEELHKVREEFERRQTDPYVPRPRWQIVMAWVLILIVVLGIINICYWQVTI